MTQATGWPAISSFSNLQEVKKWLEGLKRQIGPSGEQYWTNFPEKVDAVRYGEHGLVFDRNGLEVTLPRADEVLILPTSVSLCGTDLGLVDKALKGELPAEGMTRVVGHELAGFVVGLGADVKNWQLGDYVCLDSHYSCGQAGGRGHKSFDDCVESGQSCDGIVGGIRGCLNAEGQRLPTHNGYWSRLVTAPAGALTLPIPLTLAESLKAPSTLESLGNIYMISAKIRELGFYDHPEQTLTIVVGLGATGYPMAAVAKHLGSVVYGVNPSLGKREFSLEQKACDLATVNIGELKNRAEKFNKVVVVVTAGQPEAHLAAFDFLNTLSADIKDKAMIIFGLYADSKQTITFAPESESHLAQRDFVFSRHQFIKNKIGVYGVCGRDMKAWRQLVFDLEQPPKVGRPALVAMLNAAHLQVEAEDPLRGLTELLNQGQSAVIQLLAKNRKLKIVANLIKGSNEKNSAS